MRYHLSFGRSRYEFDAAVAARHPHALASFASLTVVNMAVRHYVTHPAMRGLVHLIVDSGAYTAHRQGHDLDVDVYGAWAARFAAELGPALASVEFMTLDVIGDQAASNANTARLWEVYGLPVTEVFTLGAPLRELERMAARSHRVALGGLVPHANDRATLDGWVARCFDVLAGAPVRVHLLGIGQPWLLERYPVASCDSAGWSSVVRSPKMAHHRPTPGTVDAREWKPEALTQAVRRVQAVERDVTAYWAARTPRHNTQPALF